MLWTVPGNAVNAVVSIIMAFKIICEPFFKICFYWIVVELQYSCSCISFCCIAKWFSYIYVHSLIWLGHCTVTYLYFTFFFFLIFWPHHKDPSSPARESNPHRLHWQHSLNLWTAKEIPYSSSVFFSIMVCHRVLNTVPVLCSKTRCVSIL